MPSSRPTPNRQKSLYLSETAFFDAAIHATVSTGDEANNDPNALHDTDQMIKIARSFLEKTCPDFLERADADRLVKVGRNVSSTMRFARRASFKNLMQEQQQFVYSKSKIDASLELLAQECLDMVPILNGTETRKVPRVRFGKTELQMPILTLGCMRFQQSWNRGEAEIVSQMDQVQDECQNNLIEILKHAIGMGMSHIETAKGYGSSELQLGEALQHLFETGFCRRQDLIIQTKGGVSSSMTPAEYKQQVLDQLELLKLDYVDLFSVHGINTEEAFTFLFENNLISALHQLKAEGKIRHVGFSTHGHASLIEKTIKTNEFEYVNLHYHFCGSYTTSGDNDGNLSNVRLAHQLDMGVFCISPYDKGGRLYAPSNNLRDLTLPDMEPMAFGSTWLWQHHLFDEEKAPVHTIVCGAARPSDLDQPIVAALNKDKVSEQRERIVERLVDAMEKAVGKSFSKTWYVGLPNWKDAHQGTQLGNIVWLHNVIKAYGLLDYSKERYAPMETNLSTWSTNDSKADNVAKMGPSWPWQPGCAVNPELDYTQDLQKCPPENHEQLLEAIRFVHKWCAKEDDSSKEDGSKEDEKKQEKLDIPLEWETSYDMRPWTAFPERS